MVHPSTKLLLTILLLILVALPFVYAAQVDDYKPYLHKATVPEHPKVKLYGSYSTSLFPGAATFTYPIDVPKGTNGLQPQLSFSYNSQSVKQRPGIMGAGWSLTQNYIYRDTNTTLSNTGDDAFKLILNGATHSLVYVHADGFWHTEIESFIRVQNISSANNTYNMYWLVTGRDGTQYRFGFTNNSELTSNTGYSYAVRWSLDRVEDVFGNKIFHSYEEDPNVEDKGTTYLSQILYNNDQQRNISFVYESAARPDRRAVYETGQKVDESRRLANISIVAAGTLVRTYHFDYIHLNNEKSLSALSKITFLGSDGASAMHNISFDYYASETPDYQKYENATWVPPIFFDNGPRDLGVRFADLNGDGFDEFIEMTESGAGTHAWLNNKNTGWNDASSTWAPPSPLWAVDISWMDNGFRFADVNSDGFADILLSSNNIGPPRRYAYLNNRTGGWTNASATWNPPIYFVEDNHSQGVDFVDVDGDGRIDILQALNNSGGLYKVYRNNGAGWTDVSASWGQAPPFIDNDWLDTGARIADINGDGLIDVLKGKQDVRRAWLNNGSGWVEDLGFAPPIDFLTTQEPDTGVRIADINGDGLSDILEHFGNSTINQSRTWINNGSGWVRNDSWDTPTSFTANGQNVGRRITDVNGDGFLDIILAFDGGLPQNKSTWIRNTTTPFLLKRITNELGGVVELVYNTSTRFNNSGDDGVSDLGFNVWVVDRVKQNNSVSGAFAVAGITSYNYSNGLYNSTDFEFRGFKQTTEFLHDNTTVVHSFHQDKALKGKEYRTEVYNGSRSVFSITNTTFNSTLVSGYFRNFLTGEKSSLYDGNAANPTITRTSSSYDNYGNLLEKTQYGEDALAGDEKTERFTFAVNTTAWIVDKVSRSELSGNGTATVRVTRYFYDNVTFGSAPLIGTLTKVENFLNGSKINPITAFTYDSFGNTKTKTDALGHTTTLLYGIRDGTYTYADRVVNALDQPTDYSYDLGTGNVLYEEKNNIRKRFTYDTFGRLLKEILPYDNDQMPTKFYNYTFDGVAPETVKVSLREHSNVTSDVYYFYDGLGNLIQLKSPADSDQQVVKNIYYDSLGRVAEEDNPYFDGFSTSLVTPIASVNKTKYTYDALARVTRVVNPDLTNKTIIFDHSTISDYDENSHRHDYTLDGFGQIVSVVEYNNDPLLGGTEKYNTTYAYSVAGELVGITDALGNTFNFTYDTLGRKTAMDDPDMGRWTYGYDLAGNLISQSGGNGGLITGDGYYREYDGFGRLKLIRNGNSAASPLLEEYWYDPDGIRIKIKRNDTAQTTIYTPFKEMMQIRNTSGVYDYTYVYQEGVLVARVNPDGSQSFYHPDHLGSTTLVTDGNANAIENTTYEPFGAEISGGNLDVKGYTGQFDDEATEQYYYGARYYKPYSGQFTSADTLISDFYDPQKLNRYSYVVNNPYKFVDPDGKEVYLVGRQVQVSVVGFFGNHYYLTLIPDKPSDFNNDYAEGLTVGAYNIGGKLQFIKNGEPRAKDQNIRYIQTVKTPAGMTDTQFIKNIIKTSENYQESNDYEGYHPLASGDKFNSNSGAITVLVASGVNAKRIKANARFLDPGISKLSTKILVNSPLPMCIDPTLQTKKETSKKRVDKVG